MLDFGILWMNARNLKYIKRFNPKKAIRLADNKLKTKKFLSLRGIPVPETFAIIDSRKTLFDFDRKSLPEKEFVIKPNKGSKWKGIMIVEMKEIWRKSEENIKKIWKNGMFFFSRFGEKMKIFRKGSNEWLIFKVWKEVYSYDDFIRRLIDILDWKYSLTFWWDKILIEEKLEPGENFKQFCQWWLADIRVIVFNLIPVAAMVRMPTPWSWGKANLAQWGVWLGIEVGSWKIKSMYYKRKIYTKDFPWDFAKFWRKKIPFWDDILLYSSKIQYFVNIWYLALDWVITDEGPKLLEINARAGLEVQNASNLPLKRRLEKIADIKVDEPAKWVDIAKSLFTTEKKVITLNKVLYLSQKWQIILEWEEEDEKIQITVEVDLKKTKNYISPDLYEKVVNWNEGDVVLDLYESEVRFKNLKFEKLESWLRKVILGRDTVSQYYIKPIKKTYQDISFINPNKIIEAEVEDIKYLDEQIRLLNNRLNLNAILKPKNYLDELDNFITWWGHYNPKFEYSRPEDKKLNETKDKILSLKEKYFKDPHSLKSQFAYLFNEKLDELLIRLYLIEAYKRQKYNEILKYNQLLFGQFNEDWIKLSKEKVFLEEDNKEILGRILSPGEVKKIVRDYLNERWFTDIKIVIDVSSLSRITISRIGNTAFVKLNPYAKFREKEIYATLAHEIDVHLTRFVSAVKTGWNILKQWTWYYLKDEEWLAVWKSFQVLPEGYEKKGMYERYYLVYEAQKNDFARVAQIRLGIRWGSLNDAFRYAFRVKKWIQNTWFVDKWAIWMKDVIYLEWFNKIRNWVESGGDVDKMMIWKIKVEDIEKIF